MTAAPGDIFASPEILEQNISRIEVMSRTTSAFYTPEGGAAKWFRDELGQVWVKFLVKREMSNDRGVLIEEHVFAARLVRVIVYTPKPPSS